MAEGKNNEFVFDEGQPLPTTVSLREARKQLGVRPLQLSEMIASGALEMVKVRKADRVTMASLRRHLPNEFIIDVTVPGNVSRHISRPENLLAHIPTELRRLARLVAARPFSMARLLAVPPSPSGFGLGLAVTIS